MLFCKTFSKKRNVSLDKEEDIVNTYTYQSILICRTVLDVSDRVG